MAGRKSHAKVTRLSKIGFLAASKALVSEHLHWWNLTALGVSPDGKWLAVGSQLDAKIFDARFPWITGIGHDVGVADAFGHRDYVRAVAFSPDSRLLATSDVGGEIRIWDIISQ
jgi:WD40 repeat protein